MPGPSQFTIYQNVPPLSFFPVGPGGAGSVAPPPGLSFVSPQQQNQMRVGIPVQNGVRQVSTFTAMDFPLLPSQQQPILNGNGVPPIDQQRLLTAQQQQLKEFQQFQHFHQLQRSGILPQYRQQLNQQLQNAGVVSPPINGTEWHQPSQPQMNHRQHQPPFPAGSPHQLPFPQPFMQPMTGALQPGSAPPHWMPHLPPPAAAQGPTVPPSKSQESHSQTPELGFVDSYWHGRIAGAPARSSGAQLGPNLQIPSSPPPASVSTPPTSVETKGLLSPSTAEARNEHSFIPNPPLHVVKDPSKPSNNAGTETPELKSLDKYAETFIPQYLQQIQKLPHHIYTLPPLPPMPLPSYCRTFLSDALITRVGDWTSNKTLLLSKPPSESLPPFEIDTYAEHFKVLTLYEMDFLSSQMERQVLWEVGIKSESFERDEYSVAASGIRENHPKVDVGDIVELREVFKDKLVGSGLAFEGRVVALRKREGFIHLNIPSLSHHITQHNLQRHETLPLFFNISFKLHPQVFFSRILAAKTVGADLITQRSTNPQHGTGIVERWLFPTEEDLRSKTPKNISTGAQLNYYDPSLNEEQKMAVNTIASYMLPIPFLISGPPGTGKTKSIVETVFQILCLHPTAHILLCAPSNSATDTLALRLSKVLKPNEMLRLNDRNRTFAEVPDALTLYCHIEDDHFELPQFSSLMHYKVVVTSCQDAQILLSANCTNNALSLAERTLMDSLHPYEGDGWQAQPHWTHLLIDEAGQGSEPELLIPMAVVLQLPSKTRSNEPVPWGKNWEPQLTLCGDPQQLGPIVASSQARDGNLDVSLLERLFERPVYSNHSRARSRLNRKPKGTSNGFFMSGDHFAAFVNLVKNYRSHPGILMSPSALFYNDTLVPFAKNGRISWSGLLNPDIPLVFLGTDSDDDCIDDRSSWFNIGQIKIVVDTIKSLVAEGASSIPPLMVNKGQIGVITPWRQQVWELRTALRKEGLGSVDVGTVEDFQGKENRIIVVSTVRSRIRFLEEDREKALGLIMERKRFNVAITRAKELLVIVGSAPVLYKNDPHWKAFFQFLLRNNLYSGPELELKAEGSYISRLETQYRRSLHRDSIDPRDVEDDLMHLTGDMAREILREEDEYV